jgi:serine/threonine protein phosphatase PrpC
MAIMTAAIHNLAADTAASTHTGMVRQCNEDCMLSRPAIGLWAVADGMGGHQAGDLASKMVVDALALIEHADSPAALLRACENALAQANARVRAVADARGLGIIGSTIALLLTFGRHFACVWSGDSRIYLLRDGAMTQLTRDHTEAQELLDRGLLTPEEALAWPRREVITRAIGVSDRANLEQVYGEVNPGDIFVLCSDGLTLHVEASEIMRTIVGKDADTACQLLIELTLSRGARDNVTVIIVRYPVEPDGRVKMDHPTPILWE